MKIEVPPEKLYKVIDFIKKNKVRHMPFRKTSSGYEIDFYPNSKLTLLLLTQEEMSVLA